jgi:hypothetical protein
MRGLPQLCRFALLIVRLFKRINLKTLMRLLFAGTLPPHEAMVASHLIRWMSKWYDIMSASHNSQSLFLPNEEAIERPPEFDKNWLNSDERVEHLEMSIRLFRELRFADFGK